MGRQEKQQKRMVYPGQPHTCHSSLPLRFAQQRPWVSLQNSKSQFFYKQSALESQGMLEALAQSSKRGGRGWHDAPHLCLPPRWEHHLSLPMDPTRPLQALCRAGLCSRWAFAEAQLSHVGMHGGSGPDFPSPSRQRPSFCIPTWIPSQQLQECGRDPLKAMLELLLPPCISPRYNMF